MEMPSPLAAAGQHPQQQQQPYSRKSRPRGMMAHNAQLALHGQHKVSVEDAVGRPRPMVAAPNVLLPSMIDSGAGDARPTLYHAPIFFPFQPMLQSHGDYAGIPYEAGYSSDMVTMLHPSMPMLMTVPAASSDSSTTPPSRFAHSTPPNSISMPEGRIEETMESTPFGPGPPIVTGERMKGPRGCNLFVFHLPNEITNWDLYVLFRRYGTILSVHIMVNKCTGLSKGYGFVSYAHKSDARNAIEAMDGFRLGKKRLKVQLKRLQDDSLDDNWENASGGELIPGIQSWRAGTSRSSSNNSHPSSPYEDDSASPPNTIGEKEAAAELEKPAT